MGRSQDEATAPVIESMDPSEPSSAKGRMELIETSASSDQFCYFSRCLDITKPSKEECQGMSTS